jgi:hypothetical protein
MMEKDFLYNRRCCLEDYRKGRLARNWQYNISLRDFTHVFSLNGYFISSPRLWELDFVVYGHGDVGERAQPKNPLENIFIFIFHDF